MVCQGFGATSSVRRFDVKERVIIYAALAILVAFIIPCCMAIPGQGNKNGIGVVISLNPT